MRPEAEYSKGLGPRDRRLPKASLPVQQQAAAVPCGCFETDLRSREGGRRHEWEYRDERARHGDAVACNQ